MTLGVKRALFEGLTSERENPKWHNASTVVQLQAQVDRVVRARPKDTLSTFPESAFTVAQQRARVGPAQKVHQKVMS
jgi:hypothetical protein